MSVFDVTDIGGGFQDGAYTLSDGFGSNAYDTSGLGLWADYSAGLPASTWGAPDMGNAGALTSMFAAQEPPSAVVAQPAPSSGGSSGYKLPAASSGITAANAEAQAAPPKSIGSKLYSTLLEDKKGELDIGKLVKLGIGLGNLLGSSRSSAAAAGQGDAAQRAAMLQAQLAAQAKTQWTPQQAAWSNQLFQTAAPQRAAVSAAALPSAIVPSRGYAGGGSVQGPIPIDELLRSLPMLYQSLGFDAAAPTAPQQFAEGGDVMAPEGALTQAAPFVGYVEGADGGQSDLIDAKLSPGEYVWDSASVSDLGDGNNAAGAAKLDDMRRTLREHKRSAPPDEIPPPVADMTGGV